MGNLTLRVTENNSANLRKVIEAGAHTLAALAIALNNRPTLLTRKEFVSEVISAGLNKEAAEALTRQAISLRNLAIKKRENVGSVLDALELSLKSSDLTKSNLGIEFPKIRSSFEQIVSSEAVGLLLKSIELFGDQVCSLTESRVFTEVRPIFSEDRDAIIGAAVFNRLRLDFQDVDTQKAVELTLDVSAIDQLLEQLEIAKKKTRVVSNVLKDRVGVERTFTNESDFGV